MDPIDVASLLDKKDAEIAGLRSHIKLHAGDTLSLDNEVALMRDHWQEAEAQIKDMKALLADCYMALHDHYHESSASHDSPPEPADEWSYGIIPLFVAIQRATGKHHGELMLDPKSSTPATL
jgi:hypothetical protein